MNDYLIVQSHGGAPPRWMKRCVESVQQWATLHGYGYRFVDDALFEFLSAAERRKLAGRTPILADLARLRWCAQLLDQDAAERVVWLDADTLVFAPESLTFEPFDSALFGREHWLQADAKGRTKIYKNVHNALCGFARGGATLPFLIEVTTRLIERVDPQHIAPQFIGPKLLSSLHSIVGFDLDERFGAISPALAGMLAQGHVERLAGLGAANLCASLSEEVDHAELVDRLLEFGELEVQGKRE